MNAANVTEIAAAASTTLHSPPAREPRPRAGAVRGFAAADPERDALGGDAGRAAALRARGVVRAESAAASAPRSQTATHFAQPSHRAQSTMM
ncbi:MAG: hypothetical protein Kow0067_06630 [Coriobacteriia bacterium]